MGVQWLSSGVVFALAAVLWLVYLVPTWFRRREYLSTERNAVRLQQTLRIMAETAEVPHQVRVEATARDVAAQEKVLHREMQRTMAIQRAQDAAASRAAAHQLAETAPAIAASVAHTSQASRRLRRSRALASVTLLAALAGVGFGVAQLAAGGGAVLLVSGAVVGAGAVVLLVQINQVSRTRTQLAQTLKPSTPAQVFEPQLRAAAPRQQQWTPVPIPKPLYLSRSEAPAVAADAADLREAAAEAERALRAAQEEATRITPPAAAGPPAASAPASVAAAPESRFARMGILDAEDSATPDLDEVLRRRRAV